MIHINILILLFGNENFTETYNIKCVHAMLRSPLLVQFRIQGILRLKLNRLA